MATIKKLGMGSQQFGGFTPYGNVTTIRAKLETNSSGAAIDSDTSAAIGNGDKVILEKLPAGMLLEDSLVIVSNAFSASVVAKLGFEYVDGVDDTTVPQDDDYFGTGLVLNATDRLRNATVNPPVRLAKDAYLIATLSGAANAEAARMDVIIRGERMGPK